MNKAYEQYLEYLKSPIDDNGILLEAAQGKHINGNVFALLKALSQSDKYSHYKIYICILKDIREAAAQRLNYYGIDNYIFVERKSDEYHRALATAKYLMTDNSFPMYFVKRREQIYLNTWHGTPIKVLGRSDIKSSTSLGNVQSNFFKADYLLFPNEYCRDIMMEDYMIERLFANKTVVIDYPRNDALHNKTFKEEILGKYDIFGKRLIAYMPTWRGTGRTVDIEEQVAATEDQVKQIAACLNDNELLFINLHFLIGNRIDITGLNNVRIFPSEYETYDFLSICDVLITDYSSVMFDYAATGGEVLLYMYDYSEYLRDKGFYFDITSLPFKMAYNANELGELLHTAPIDKALTPAFSGNHYGHAAQAVLNLWLEGDEGNLNIRDYRADNETEVLYVGDLNKPLVRTLMNVCLSRFDADARDHLVVAFDCSVTLVAAEALSGLDSSIHFVNLYMIKNRNYSKVYLSEFGQGDSPQFREAIDAYSREANRLLGNLNYRKLTYINTSTPDRLITLTFAPGYKEAFGLPAFLMGEKAFPLVYNRNAYERLLNSFDNVIAYPSDLLSLIPDNIPFGGIKTELKNLNCCRIGSETMLQMELHTVCDQELYPPAKIKIGEVCLDCSISEEKMSVQNGSTDYTFTLTTYIDDRCAQKLIANSDVGVIFNISNYYVLSPICTSTNAGADPMTAISIPSSDKVLTLRSDSKYFSIGLRDINITDSGIQRLMFSTAWRLHRLSPGHRSIIICDSNDNYRNVLTAIFCTLKDCGVENVYYIQTRGNNLDTIRPEYIRYIISKFSLRHYYELFSSSTIITSGDIEDCLESDVSISRFRRQILHGPKNHLRLDSSTDPINNSNVTGKRRICVSSSAKARQVLETTGYKKKEIWQIGSLASDNYDNIAEQIIGKMKEDGLI